MKCFRINFAERTLEVLVKLDVMESRILAVRVFSTKYLIALN